jgi:hypothetical protein
MVPGQPSPGDRPPRHREAAGAICSACPVADRGGSPIAVSDDMARRLESNP